MCGVLAYLFVTFCGHMCLRMSVALCTCMISRLLHCSLLSFHHERFRSCAAIQEEISYYKHLISREYRSWLSNGIVVDSASSVSLYNDVVGFVNIYRNEHLVVD